MNILLTGGSGFLGKLLYPALVKNGHTVTILGRESKQSPPVIGWNPYRDELPRGIPKTIDIVLNLQGANIATSRWTASYKKEILSSRIKTTKHLLDQLLLGKYRPSMFISASAIGIYERDSIDPFSEDGKLGDDFLAKVCKAWEQVVTKHKLNTNKVFIRSGLVLEPSGGLLAKIIPTAKFGGNAVIGNGEQLISWIHWKDWVNAILFIINNPTVSGPVNLVAPHPVSQRVFANELSQTLKIKQIIRMPEIAIRLALGEMSVLLLTGHNIRPQRLTGLNFSFQYPTISNALTNLLNGT